MKNIVKAWSCVLLMGGLVNLASAQSSASSDKNSKPNILLFFIDDLGWADIGANGSKFYETPNIDQLAKNGVNLKNSYSAHAVCSPTRAALMSGKAPQRVGITQWIHQPSKIHLKSEEFTLAEALQENGYKTGYIGKWHLGEKDDQLPTSQGYSWKQAVNRAGQPGSYFYPYQGSQNRGAYWNIPDLDNGKKGDYLTNALTDKAIKFIDQNKSQPFFLTFAHYAVHVPLQAPADLVNKYRQKRQKLYSDSQSPSSQERYDTQNKDRQDDPTYAAMMENLDTNVGRVISKLNDEGLLENTIIIFTSDNGGLSHLQRPGVTSNKPLRSGKGWNYEGGIRVPHIISWSGKIKPSVNATPTITMDIYPTVLDLAGLRLRPKQHLDGMSIKSTLIDQPSKQLRNRFLAWTYPHNHGSGHRPSHAIQKDGWKLIHFESGDTYELYNLSDDIGESKNLASEHPKKVKQLDGLLMNWIKETTPKEPIFKK